MWVVARNSELGGCGLARLLCRVLHSTAYWTSRTEIRGQPTEEGRIASDGQWVMMVVIMMMLEKGRAGQGQQKVR